MEAPIFINKSSKYIFTWKEVECEVARMHIGHDTTSCQLIFSKGDKHILRTRINIETHSARSKLAKELEAAFPIKDKTWNWDDCVEYIVEKSMRALEHGEPVITLETTDEIAPLEYLLYPLIPLGKSTAIFAPPGKGKSQLAVLISLILRLPWPENPLNLVPPDKPVKLLYLDYEGDKDDILRPLSLIVKGMELGWCDMEYRRCFLPLIDDIDGIKNHMEEKGCTVLMIDSTSMAAGGDLIKMDIATAYSRAIRQLGSGVTTVSLAHTAKNNDTGGSNPSVLGSVLFTAGFRSIWELASSEFEGGLDLALMHRKANLSKKHKDIGFRLNYLEDRTIIEYLDPKSIPDFVERMSVNARVIDRLKRGKISSQELMIELRLTRPQVDVAIKRLRDKKLIAGASDGWYLPTRGNEPLL